MPRGYKSSVRSRAPEVGQWEVTNNLLVSAYFFSSPPSQLRTNELQITYFPPADSRETIGYASWFQACCICSLRGPMESSPDTRRGSLQPSVLRHLLWVTHKLKLMINCLIIAWYLHSLIFFSLLRHKLLQSWALKTSRSQYSFRLTRTSFCPLEVKLLINAIQM